MAILDQIAAARDPSFSSRVAMILMNQSLAVLAEDPATTNHANRLAFAEKHFRAEINCKTLAAAVIANDPSIQGQINTSPSSFGSVVADADIATNVTALFDTFATAYTT